jgi:butyryl-CoA dehydrogenase
MLLTETQAMIRDTARAFAESHLKPNAARWDAGAIFPSEALAELGKLGFMGA